MGRLPVTDPGRISRFDSDRPNGCYGANPPSPSKAVNGRFGAERLCASPLPFCAYFPFGTVSAGVATVRWPATLKKRIK